MPDPEKKEKTGQEQQPGEGGGAADKNKAGGGEGAGGGDLSVALKQERERRKALQDEVEALKKQVAKGGSGGADLDLSQFEITDDEVVNGNAAEINRKMREAIQTAYRSMDDRINSRLQGLTSGQMVDSILSKYSVFSHDDAELRGDAIVAATRAVKQLGENFTEDDLDTAIGGVAKRFSRYVAQKAAEAEADDEDEDLPPAGGGAAEAAHLSTDEPPKSMREAKALARKLFKRAVRSGSKR